MFSRSVSIATLVLASLATAACGSAPAADDSVSTGEDLTSGPGARATDARTPELGSDLTIVNQSQISLADGVAQVAASKGPVVEAKFELADDGKSLSLSIYPVKNGLTKDSERNVFQEASGDPT